MMRLHRIKFLTIVFPFIAILFFNSCSYQVNPATGKRELFNKSWKAEQEQALTINQEIQKKLPLVANKRIKNYLQSIANSIAKESPFMTGKKAKNFPGFFVSVDVVESESVSAFSVPPSSIYVSTGLLSILENEAQLAYVLAHEIGHLTYRPFSSKQVYFRKATPYFIPLMKAVEATFKQNSFLPSSDELWLNYAHIEYSQEAENLAQHAGMLYAGNAGYEAAELERARRLLQTTSMGKSVLLPYTTIHPKVETSKKATPNMAAFWVDHEQDPIINEEIYIKQLQNLPFKTVEHGYKNKRKVIHPKLSFQFLAPLDWILMTQKNKLILVNEPEDAILYVFALKKSGTVSAKVLELINAAQLPSTDPKAFESNGRAHYQVYTQFTYNQLDYSAVIGAVELDAMYVMMILTSETERFDAFKTYFSEPFITLNPTTEPIQGKPITKFVMGAANVQSNKNTSTFFSDSLTVWIDESEFFKINQIKNFDDLKERNWIKTLVPKF